MDDAAPGLEKRAPGTAAGQFIEKIRPDGAAAAALARASRAAAATAARQVQSAADLSARRIRTFPVTSAAVALGAGLLLGALLSPRRWFGGSAERGPEADRHAIPKSR